MYAIWPQIPYLESCFTEIKTSACKDLCVRMFIDVNKLEATCMSISRINKIGSIDPYYGLFVRDIHDIVNVMELQSVVWSYFWFKKDEALYGWPWRKMWKDTQNLILFKISSGEWGMINLLHVYLEWFIFSNMQAFLYENTLKYLVNKWETHLEPLWKQKLGNITLAFSDACTNLLSLWKPSVNYILKSWDFPTFGKFLACKRWLQEKLFTSIPWESSGHKRSWKLVGGALLFLDFLWSYSQGRQMAVHGREVFWPTEAAASPQTWFSDLGPRGVLFSGCAGIWTQLSFHTIAWPIALSVPFSILPPTVTFATW